MVGAGERLFGETSGKKPFRLTGSQTVGNGLLLLTYAIVRDASPAPDGASVPELAGVRAFTRSVRRGPAPCAPRFGPESPRAADGGWY